jgi:tRNA(Ser,Leu) C12 N-acetylase TAN1
MFHLSCTAHSRRLPFFKNIEVNLKDPRRPVAEILGLWAVIDVTPNSTGYEQKMI